MDTDQITPAGKAKLACWGLQETSSLNVLSAAFQIACLTIEKDSLLRMNQEVGATASLVTTIWQQAKECAAEFGTRDSPGCEWVQYRNKRSTVTEAESGADFAVVIRLAKQQSRIAIFQAKLPRSEDPEMLEVHQMSPAVEKFSWPPEPQFTRLVRFGDQVLQHASSSSHGLSAMRWLHYLHYLPGICNSYSVNQMGVIEERYLQRGQAHMHLANSIPLNEMLPERLCELLKDGAEITTGPFPEDWGWLEVPDAVAAMAILDAAEIKMTVYEAIDRSTGPVLALNDEATLLAHDIIVTLPNSTDDASPADTPSGVVANKTSEPVIGAEKSNTRRRVPGGRSSKK